jgi:hypothetical protein
VPQVNRWILVVAGLLLTGLTGNLMAQGPSKELAIKLMSLPPRPKRPELPASRLPLQFLQGERIAFLGNSLAERMNLFRPSGNAAAHAVPQKGACHPQFRAARRIGHCSTAISRLHGA